MLGLCTCTGLRIPVSVEWSAYGLQRRSCPANVLSYCSRAFVRSLFFWVEFEKVCWESAGPKFADVALSAVFERFVGVGIGAFLAS